MPTIAKSRRLERLGDGVPVLTARVGKAVAQQVDHAGLGDRLWPDGGDRVGQAGQPVAHDHEHVGHAPVAQLGEHVQPVLGALAAVTGPQPEDVAPSYAG